MKHNGRIREDIKKVKKIAHHTLKSAHHHVVKKGSPFAKQFIHNLKAFFKKHTLLTWFYLIAGFFIIVATLVVVWGVILQIPDISDFDTRKVVQSIDLYDRNGEKLYSTGTDITRIIAQSESISPYMKNAAIAAEDARFYSHNGVVFSSTMRAILLTILRKLHLRSGSIQGGSTITQQVIKNTLLTQDQTIVRKMKEWILALKIENRYTKDQILTTYLNESPYGGRIYGVRTASEAFFGKEPSDITLAEAAYLASIPNAPSYLSPYGSHKDKLDIRKNYVLDRMLELGLISTTEHATAKAEEVVFLEGGTKTGSHAIHFIEYVLSTLPDIIDESRVEEGGLKIYTTLDLELQEKAEDIIRTHALASEKEWNASNSSLVAIDPKTGDIIAMVGSRGYSDPEIDGKYNIALARRQPGSSFKPFIYSTAFEQGFTPETVIFDTQTQFGTDCAVSSPSSVLPCYSPDNYDGVTKGPMTLRSALAESRNIPAVKLFYIVGMQNALSKAKAMGISTLGNINQYGLTLVLGGGEVTLLDMTSAYGTFANDGTHVAPRAVTRIDDENGVTIATVESKGEAVLSPEAARKLNSVLSDNVARTPLFGANSGLYFANTPVAAKSGTTNSNKDAWLIGYMPNLVVGVWSGNNDNTPMKKGSAINIKPWRQFFDAAFQKISYEPFIPPAPTPITAKPVLRGIWQGGESYTIDTISGGLATELTPEETRKEIVYPNPHDILHWIKKGDPTGPSPENPAADPQYERFEYGAQAWIAMHGGVPAAPPEPTFDDNVHTESTRPKISSFSCDFDGTTAVCEANFQHDRPLKNYTVLVNGVKAVSGDLSENSLEITVPVSDFITPDATQADITLTIADSVWSKDTKVETVTLP